MAAMGFPVAHLSRAGPRLAGGAGRQLTFCQIANTVGSAAVSCGGEGVLEAQRASRSRIREGAAQENQSGINCPLLTGLGNKN